MNISELVDMETLCARLAKEGKSVFHHWTQSALDVCGDKYHSIIIHEKCYDDIPENELHAGKFDSFVRGLLNIMPTIEHKKTLLRIEALSERLFER